MTINLLTVTECGRQRSKAKTILLQRSALRKFHVEMVKTRMIRLRVIEGPIASDEIAFCAVHSFLVEVQTNPGYRHATHA